MAGNGQIVQGNVINSVTGNNAYGIYSYNVAFARQNQISNAKAGISGGKYQDNLFTGCATPFTGGTDAGGND